MFERGWIICNGEIPIYHTLRVTRKDCIRDYRIKRAMSRKLWDSEVRRGDFSCRKVDLVFNT